MLKRAKKLYIVTTNKQHPAYEVNDDNLEVISYDGQIDFHDLFMTLKNKGVDRLTVQSGGNMNAVLARRGLIDFVSIVVAPLLVSGKDTPTLLDGKSLDTVEDLKMLQPLELLSANMLQNSYLHLRYKVRNKREL